MAKAQYPLRIYSISLLDVECVDIVSNCLSLARCAACASDHFRIAECPYGIAYQRM